MANEVKVFLQESDFIYNRYKQFVIAGDIGATNARLRVSGIRESRNSVYNPEPLFDLKLPSSSLNSFISQISAALQIAKNRYGISIIKNSAFGVAGRLSDDRTKCTITFLDWGNEVPLVQDLNQLGIENVYLMNDLEAGIYGLQFVDRNNLLKISDESTELPKKDNYKLILGMPGTGYGSSFRDSSGMANPTEAGGRAVSISPTDKTEHDLILRIYREINKDNLTRKNGRLPTYDYVVSGPGIRRIKDVLLEQERYHDYPAAVKDRINNASGEKQARIISDLALGRDADGECRQPDSLCQEVIEVFTKFFARSMQDLALITLPEAVFLAGNIVESNRDLIKLYFMDFFTSHLNHGAYLSTLPVYIITDEQDLNLKGATHVAANLSGT